MDPALEPLWNDIHDRLHRFICSRLPDEDDADDILQDVFLRIHDRLDTVHDARKLEGWVFQIARNCIADYYRARRRMVPLYDRSEGDEAQAGDEPGDDDAIVQNLAADIREIVLTLPEPYRQALILTEYEGLSQKELADRLGISLSGAKSRVQRARQKIKDALLSCCHFEFDARGLVYEYRAHCCACSDRTPNACR
jgi:RNA polymerase sigma-70 factor (ECF subfamily)